MYFKGKLKSEFRPSAYAVSFGIVLSLVCTAWLTFNNIFDPEVSLVATFFWGLLFLYMDILMVFGELRVKLISVAVCSDGITIKRYLGFLRPEIFYFEQMDGYKISYVSNRSQSYEHLYLMVAKKKVIALSAFYHKNYSQLKQTIVSRDLPYLGSEIYSNLREFKEIFIQ